MLLNRILVYSVTVVHVVSGSCCKAILFGIVRVRVAGLSAVEDFGRLVGHIGYDGSDGVRRSDNQCSQED
jgi:hypothetical protein